MLQLTCLPLASALALACAAFTAPTGEHETTVFTGAKVNGGTVTHRMDGTKHVLTVSDDFVIPDTPAPHWQLVDADGNVYLLQRLMVKGMSDGMERQNRSIVVPEFVPDVATVQIWCAWAETLLGEASFAEPLPLYRTEAAPAHRSTPFKGVKANTGSVTHRRERGRSVLTLSEDFEVPDAPAPHWQVVDSKGRRFLLQRLDVKGDRVNRTIVVPPYVEDVAKVEIWCAWAETLLGEASFASPVR
jgi:hypothetical protein